MFYSECSRRFSKRRQKQSKRPPFLPGRVRAKFVSLLIIRELLQRYLRFSAVHQRLIVAKLTKEDVLFSTLQSHKVRGTQKGRA